MRVQFDCTRLAGQQLPDQFLQALRFALDALQVCGASGGVLLGQRQGDAQARQWRAQFVGHVCQQALLCLYPRLQLCGHAVEVARQLVGFIAAAHAHRQPCIQFTAGQAARGELQLRSDRLARRTREAGIDYDIFSDPSRPSQAWLLDLMPILIAAAQWRWLQTALTQRARLFDAILHDVYGPQKTLKKGIIPPELVFSDPTYLTPCRDILPKAGPLRFYAADLARDDNGLWRVIDSHTETLAGLGFAVANRVIHSHVVGDVMRGCNATSMLISGMMGSPPSLS